MYYVKQINLTIPEWEELLKIINTGWIKGGIEMVGFHTRRVQLSAMNKVRNAPIQHHFGIAPRITRKNKGKKKYPSPYNKQPLRLKH